MQRRSAGTIRMCRQTGTRQLQTIFSSTESTQITCRKILLPAISRKWERRCRPLTPSRSSKSRQEDLTPDMAEVPEQALTSSVSRGAVSGMGAFGSSCEMTCSMPMTFLQKRNGQPRPVLKQNQFGFTAGGPIHRDNLFVFAAYQGTTQRNGDSNLSLVTAILPQIGSDRSASALGSQFCPANHLDNPGYQTFAGGKQILCDGSNINSVALAFLNFKDPNGQYAIPSPQTALPSDPQQLPIGESTYSIPASYREDQYTGNVDYLISNKNQLAARFFYSPAPTVEPFSPFGANIQMGNE